jgi:hypothetical protein
MKTYRVFFSQINQSYYEVQANNEESARKKGMKEWQLDNKHPRHIGTEKQ